MNGKRAQLKPVLFAACLLLPLTSYSKELKPYNGIQNKTFQTKDLNGQIHKLQDYRGKVLLINFWASWCKPCVKELPELTGLKTQFSDLPFEILAINTSESIKKVIQFTKNIDYKLPVLMDTSSKVLFDWKVKMLPTSFLIDKKGLVRYVIRGNPGWDNKQILKTLKTMINE